MQLLNSEVEGFLSRSSMIRKMFEAGIELKKRFGADQVYDFSLGNPDLPPPAAVKSALQEVVDHLDEPFSLGYMPNAGFMEVREMQARAVSADQQVEVPAANVVMTCGAAGGINALFRAILAPGDEVVCPAPYFVEYDFYAGNFGGKLVKVPSDPDDFSLDIAGFEKAINPRTRAVIVNSPNNPTGRIYTRKELTELADVLAAAERKFGRAIYLISDEPYRFLNFENAEIAPVFGIYAHSVVIGSYSKNLSLAGERIGFVALNPAVEKSESEVIMAAVILTNRILGYVNAPVLAQKILLKAMSSQVDLEVYRRRRDAMKKVLDNAGISYFMPQGAFFMPILKALSL